MPKSPVHRPVVFLALPQGNSWTTQQCAQKAFLQASQTGLTILPSPAISSILPLTFDMAWAEALNRRNGVEGEHGPIDYFVMLHSDINPQKGWLDILVSKCIRYGADIVSALVPIKNEMGLTSTALDQGNLWKPRRLTMTEAMQLPPDFSAETLEHEYNQFGTLLANTGCWIADFSKPWVTATKEDPENPANTILANSFHFSNRIRIDADGRAIAEVIPEDWHFSKDVDNWCMEHEGRPAKIYVTRQLQLTHIGEMQYPNDCEWGLWKTDHNVVPESPIPDGYELVDNETLSPVGN